jgi:hypothetical protein
MWYEKVYFDFYLYKTYSFPQIITLLTWF